MSWISKLYETYEKAAVLDLPINEQITPVSHTPQNAHINIVIDAEGNFRRAEVSKTQIILPATESSAGRSSGEAPHPLADKLQYVAKDYADYGGRKNPYFDSYINQLEKWCNSEFSHPHVTAVYCYVKKGTVIRDLIEYSIVYISEDNTLLTKWEDGDIDPPALFKSLPKEKGELDQGNAMICWTVEAKGDPASKTWQNKSIRDHWVSYTNSLGGITGLCYVSGLQKVLTTNHPAKLRHTGDKAKLISANDMDGFTFRGRFTDSSKQAVKKTGYQSVSVGMDVSQKAHNTLQWLIDRQGFRNGEQVIVSWAVSGKEIPQLTQDTWSMLGKVLPENTNSESQNEIDQTIDVGESFAHSLNKFMAGYRAKLAPDESIVIMGLDSASPGRMGITYYRETFAHEFIDVVSSWHKDMAWRQRYKMQIPDGRKKPKIKIIWPISTPSPNIIWEAVYGKSLTDSLKKNLTERILPCIVEGRPIPFDIVSSSIKRASNPNGMDNWEWEQCLGVACSLFKGYYKRHPDPIKQRNYFMTLEKNNTSRDYLYGRLLAVAERIEYIALQVADEKRSTTAERMMQRFADRPYSSWRNIELALQPYVQRLKNSRTGFLVNRQKELDNIMNSFPHDEFTSDEPLSGEFLLGFHCQRLALQQKTETTTEQDE
ncbi:MAG: type I-C CRISPR-associated protein Cas8c/Csd1 [Gammaproteobacteria bacterium]|nr:type I-C CRISPR-associated protein Cas8c/Csd1 [Gammaproteobacteria bacterium]